MNTKKATGKLTSGFTLIELLIAIAIVGIVAAVALPNYFESVQKSRRTDATESLMRLSVLQEQYFSQYESYATSSSALASLNGGSDQSTQEYYKISVTAAPVNGFTLAAEAINGQEKDTQCKFFVIDSTNKRSSGTSASDNSGNCW